MSAALAVGAEVDLRHFHLILGDGEVLERLVGGVPELRPEDRREGAQREVVIAHGVDVVAAGHRDAVLGAFQLRLQGEEVLVGLQVGIVLDDSEQARQRAGEAGLAFLEGLEGFRIGQLLGGHLHLRLRRLGSRLDDGL